MGTGGMHANARQQRHTALKATAATHVACNADGQCACGRKITCMAAMMYIGWCTGPARHVTTTTTIGVPCAYCGFLARPAPSRHTHTHCPSLSMSHWLKALLAWARNQPPCTMSTPKRGRCRRGMRIRGRWNLPSWLLRNHVGQRRPALRGRSVRTTRSAGYCAVGHGVDVDGGGNGR